jgi:hypothetical protein
MVEVLADAARYVAIVLLVLLLLGLRERVPTITGSWRSALQHEPHLLE